MTARKTEAGTGSSAAENAGAKGSKKPVRVIENVLQPGKSYRVDAAKFDAMLHAVMAAVPENGPGMTPAQIIAAVTPLLPEELFPEGTAAGWWVKAVQLDAEAKGTLRRAASPPVRLWRQG